MLSGLKESGIIQEMSPGSGRRGSVMVFPRLLVITETDSFEDHP
jgi:hypothetical protein